MRWYQRYNIHIASVVGYILFVAVAVASFCLLTSNRIMMDSLIAFLLSQTLGMVVLHFMRRGIVRLLKRRVSSQRYGVFLLVNAAVILINAFMMYVMDLMSDYHEMSLLIFSTVLLVCVNIIMQVLHSKPVGMMENEE